MRLQVKKMKTIVSVTPTRLEADSRSFKVASSIARLGYVSILVEGQKSTFDGARLPFRLSSMSDSFIDVLPSSNDDRRTCHDWKVSLRRAWRIARDSTPLLPFLFLLWYFQRYVVVALRSIPRASLYYLHGYAHYPALCILSKRYKAPIIYDAHDYYSGINSPTEIAALNFGRRWIATFYRHLEARLIQNAAATVTVAHGVAMLQQKTFGRSAIVIRNCHDYRIDRNPLKSLRESLKIPLDFFLLVVMGNCKPGMAIQEVLEALQELPPKVHLAFVGSFYDRFLNDIRRRRLEDRVHIVRPIKPYEVVPFIKSANASILLYYPRSANYRNCLPNGFFQAIAAELPLLYPTLQEIRQIAEDYDIGTPINPRVPRSISAAIIGLMNDPSRMARYRRNLQKAAHDLGWEKEERILATVILDAFDRGQP